jgi:ubiquitin C-terminal hydrolase
MGGVTDEAPLTQTEEVSAPPAASTNTYSCPHYVARTKLLATYKPKSSTGFVGLRNQGGTCYLNSLLQTLFMTPEFRNHILDWHFDADTRPERNIPYQLQALMARMQESHAAAIDTKPLTASFGWDNSDTFVQHDVQELNRVLFQAIDQYASKTGTPCFIPDLYEQEVVDYIRCTKCQARRQRVDKYQDIALVVKGCKTLEASLDNYVLPETLEGIECESCGGKRDATKGLEFRDFPPILTLQLRRFDFDYQTCQRVKLNDAMAIPLAFDATRWRVDPKTDAGSAEYHLLSILLHRGSALGGHYFAYIRDVAADKWYEFNDESVEEVALDTVSKCLNLDEPEAPVTASPTLTPPHSSFSVLGEGIIGPLFEGESRQAANASHRASPYMLVYRSSRLPLRDPNTFRRSLPPAVADAVLRENAEADDQRVEFERVRDLIELKVMNRDTHHWLVCSQLATIRELTKRVYEEVLSVEERERVPLAQVRIRSYNETFIMLGRSYTADLDRTLKEVGLHALSAIAVDIRAAEQPWVEYTCDNLALHVKQWSDGAGTWQEFVTQIRGDATASDLRAHLATLSNLPEEHLLVVYKETANKGRIIGADSGHLRLREDLCIRQLDPLYVEDARQMPVTEAGEKQPRGIQAIESVNFWTFRYNVPPSEAPTESLAFDSRRSFQDLKDAIAKRLGLAADDFSLKRDKRSQLQAGNPMTATIKHTMLQGGAALFVELGKPLSDSDLNVSVFRYSLKQGVEHLDFLFKRVVARDTPIAILRRDLAEATGIPADRLRLREVQGTGVRQALTLATLRDHYAEGKGNAPQIAAQEVPAPEALTPNDLILRVTPYQPEADRCGAAEQREVIVARTATVRQLKRTLGELYGLERITLAKALNAVLLDHPRNVLFDNIGSYSTVEQYHESIITKPPLSLRDNDNLLFKEGEEFTKPGGGSKKSKPAAEASHRPVEKALVIRTEFGDDSEEAPMPDLTAEHLQRPESAALGASLAGLSKAATEFDDTAAEIGDEERSELNSLPDVDDVAPDDEYGPGIGTPLPEQYDPFLHLLRWDSVACTDMDAACAICLAEYEEGENVGVTPCQHSFHPECFQTWFESNPSCPSCLIPFPT